MLQTDLVVYESRLSDGVDMKFFISSLFSSIYPSKFGTNIFELIFLNIIQVSICKNLLCWITPSSEEDCQPDTRDWKRYPVTPGSPINC